MDRLCLVHESSPPCHQQPRAASDPRSFRDVGGEHCLSNYRSLTTVQHTAVTGGAVVVESYIVDVPAGNTADETRTIVDTIVRCNL
ncbi:hypothetical protein QYE76_014145 [Lolium multiflorum]|uniref:Uncharacterized protein n=1 Tax=Lolium multiflorum TaxID=4521 RepID=A0AAD8U3Z6_LOLMU|nr:hypothetical protein QYE76_014145 [Lolium multiflorum]